jgi:hypothetical protein
VASASLAHFSPLSPSLSLHPMPDNNACTDPTTITVAAHPRSEPLTDCGSSGAAMIVGPTSHLSLPLSSLCMATTHRICAANRVRQSTHRSNIYFYHLPYKQARHTGSMHDHQHAKHKQTSVSSAPTYTHI